MPGHCQLLAEKIAPVRPAQPPSSLPAAEKRGTLATCSTLAEGFSVKQSSYLPTAIGLTRAPPQHQAASSCAFSCCLLPPASFCTFVLLYPPLASPFPPSTALERPFSGLGRLCRSFCTPCAYPACRRTSSSQELLLCTLHSAHTRSSVCLSPRASEIFSCTDCLRHSDYLDLAMEGLAWVA